MGEEKGVYILGRDFISLGVMPETEEIEISLMVETIGKLYELFDKEKYPMESFDSFVNRLIDESINRRILK